MKDRPLILGVAVPARRYRPFPNVLPVRSGRAMLARDADNCLEGVMLLLLEDDADDGTLDD